MLCGWEGNRMSGVTLAMCHILNLWAEMPGKGSMAICLSLYYPCENANEINLLLIQCHVCVVVSVRFYENWLLATYFIKWMHRWRLQQAIVRQSDYILTLAASVRCRRVFAHWKHCILPFASCVTVSFAISDK